MSCAIRERDGEDERKRDKERKTERHTYRLTEKQRKTGRGKE